MNSQQSSHQRPPQHYSTRGRCPREARSLGAQTLPPSAHGIHSVARRVQRAWPADEPPDNVEQAIELLLVSGILHQSDIDEETHQRLRALRPDHQLHVMMRFHDSYFDHHITTNRWAALQSRGYREGIYIWRERERDRKREKKMRDRGRGLISSEVFCLV